MATIGPPSSSAPLASAKNSCWGAKTNRITHFDRSPPDGDCYRRAIEVEGKKGVPVETELREVEAKGSSREL